MSTIMLCLLCAVAMVVQPASAAPVGKLKPAENEELTLLFHGALQLGQALNSAYRSTEARLMEARHSVDLYGRALGLLGQEVSQGWDAAQELRTSLLEIQTEEDALKLQAEATAHALQKVAQGQQVLQDSMQQLEVRLRGAWLGHARQEFEALKAYADEQSHIVWALTGHVQRQRREMEAQEYRLRQIQESSAPSLSLPGGTEDQPCTKGRFHAHAAPARGGDACPLGLARPRGPASGHEAETEAGGDAGRGHGTVEGG
ncbi:angiopoietin-like protein 8 isoform X1 [Rhinolophus sinicus]|uniref:angiopoietin-like protein 8 isoform X1 n=1 Tax=Rhinolophus sinicus TaxID=89399 RepID=UPI003D795375